MEKLRRILKWLVAGVGALLFLAVVIVAIYTRTENFTRWLREEAITVVNQTIRGTISVDRLEGSVWSRLTLYNVTLRHEQSEILKIPRLEVFFSLIPLLWGELKIAGIDATEPSASLLQDQAGQWNLVEALAPRQPEPEKPSELHRAGGVFPFTQREIRRAPRFGRRQALSFAGFKSPGPGRSSTDRCFTRRRRADDRADLVGPAGPSAQRRSSNTNRPLWRRLQSK